MYIYIIIYSNFKTQPGPFGPSGLWPRFVALCDGDQALSTRKVAAGATAILIRVEPTTPRAPPFIHPTGADH